jgi:hypothetical protein
MLNLAAIKYRNVLSDFGGPIVKICCAPFSVYGKQSIQANAFLASGLIPRKPVHEIYGNADGCGLSESSQVARYMAVSEALERWAFHTEYGGPNARRYGFDKDCSTNGMAAFPGLLKSQSRKRAHFEALERWALISWWDNRISSSLSPVSFGGINILRLHHPANFGEVVIAYRQSKSGHVSYGKAAASSLAGATARAVSELARNEFVVTYHKLRGGKDDVRDFFERRVLYFATPEGHEEFLAKIQTKPTKEAPVWRTIFDGEIPGPWSKYATVWRTAPAMPTQDFLDRRLNFFYW